jgi:hypothetical protein
VWRGPSHSGGYDREMRRRVLALIAALAGAGVPVGASATARIDYFRTPSKNISCAYFPRQGSSPASLRCDILSGLRPEPRGRCDGDWTGLAMGVAGRAGPTCAGDTVFLASARVLGYGRSWRRDGISCTSRRTGLTCTNRARRGFFLARERWRVF